MKSFFPTLGLFLISIGIPGAPSAVAGVWSHGGSSVVCRDPGGKIQSVQLLDSYEAEHLWGLKLDRSSDDGVLLERAMDRLSVHPWLRVRLLGGMLPYYAGNYWVLSPGEPLEPIDDTYSDPGILKPGCHFQQLAVCHARGIRVDGSLYPLLDSLDRATLALHEVMYLLQKERYPELRDSRMTRALVGQLIAENPDDERIKALSHQIALPFSNGVYVSGSCRIGLEVVITNPSHLSYIQLRLLGDPDTCPGYRFREQDVLALFFDQEPGYFGNERVGFEMEGSTQAGCIEEVSQKRRFCRED